MPKIGISAFISRKPTGMKILDVVISLLLLISMLLLGFQTLQKIYFSFLLSVSVHVHIITVKEAYRKIQKFRINQISFISPNIY